MMLRYPGLAAFLLVLLPFSLPAQEASPFPTSRDHLRDRFSIHGTVRDFSTGQGVGDATVDLRLLGGGTIATVNTGQDGQFIFNSISSGDYYLTANGQGYGEAGVDVQVADGPAFGIQIFIRRVGAISKKSAATVSVRELSIPHKARDAMQKGLRLLYEKSQYEKSLGEFQRAIQAYPDYYEAYAQMGVAYLRLNQPDQAVNALHTSIEMSKEKYVDAYFLLAMAYTNAGHYEEALPLARKGTELDPQSWQSQYELARALYGLNRNGAAETAAEAAAKLQPQNGTILLELAKIHSKQRNYAAVLHDLDAYLKIAPKGPQTEQIREVRDHLRESLASANGETAPAPSAAKP